QALQARIHEAVANYFLVAAIYEQEPQALARDRPLRHRLRALRRFRVHAGDVVEAVNAAHFLDEILLDRDIEAVARRNHAEDVAGARDLHAESAQDVLDLCARDLDPEEARDTLRPQRDARPLRQLRLILRHDCGPRTTAGNLYQQLSRTLDGTFLAARVYAPLEALRSVRHEAKAARD